MSKKEFIFSFLFFLVLTLIFFHKIFFGLIPLASDLIVGAYFPWAGYKWGYEVGVPVKNNMLTDSVSIVYPLRMLATSLIKNGELPLWNSQIFSGTPLLSGPSLGLFFPTNILYFLFSLPNAWTIQVLFQPLLACFFTYLLLRHLKLPIIPSFFGGVVYGFGGFSMIYLDWNSQATTSAMFPLIILTADKLIIEKKLKWGILLSIAISLQIFSGYFPVIIFSLFGLGIWTLIRRFNTKGYLRIFIFLTLGILLSSIFLIPALEFLQNSQRVNESVDFDNVFVPYEFLISFFAPDFFGNHSTRNFWGKINYLNVAHYSGIIALFLASLSLVKFRLKEIQIAIILFILTFLITFPNPLSIFLYSIGVWGGTSITMNRTLFLINFSISLLSSFGLYYLAKIDRKLLLRISIYVFSFLLGVTLGMLINKFILGNYPRGLEYEIQKIDIALKNLILPLFFGLCFVLLILLFIWKKVPLILIQIAFLSLIIIELFRFGLKFNTFSKREFLYPQTSITNFLLKFPNERHLSEAGVIPPNMWVPLGLESPAGYDAFYPKNISKLIGVINVASASADQQKKGGIIDRLESPALDKISTKFILALKRDDRGEVNENGNYHHRFNLPKFKKIFEDKTTAILENKNSYPRAYLVSDVQKISEYEILKKLIDPNEDLKNISYTFDFEKKYELADLENSNPKYVRLANNHVQVKYKSSADSFLVVLDTFYPGWKAFIGSKEYPIYRTNFAFRGVEVPKGEHSLDFIYDPLSFKLGGLISILTLGFLLVILLNPRITTPGVD